MSMSIRHGVKTVAASAAALAVAGGVSALTLTGPAFATGPAGGTEVPNSAIPTGPYTAGTPFSSGQILEVTIPANSTLPASSGVQIVECAVPAGGGVPTDPSTCDGLTINSDTIYANTDGSVDYSNYQVFSVPNSALGESSSGQPKCDLSHQCVLYIGNAFTDLTQPHFWSTPFYVNPNGGSITGADPGDGTPEVPLAIGLPLAAAAIGGGLLFLRRRRSAVSAA